MAWFTAADSTNLIATVSYDTEYRLYSDVFGAVLQKRVTTTTTNTYFGIAFSSGSSITATLGGETGAVNATMNDNGNGSCTVVQVIQSSTSWGVT